MSATKLPAILFYPSDWMTDLKVQSLNFEQKGIWFAILCVMHESEERGKLCENGEPMSLRTLAKLIGCDLRKCSRTMDELLAKKVAYIDDKGIIYNKRMVKDEHIRKIRQQAGMLGGNPDLDKQKNKKGAKHNPPPSYSTSNTSTISLRVQELRSLTVDSETWLTQAADKFKMPAPAIIDFINNWIITAQLRYQFDRYENNILIGFVITDLLKHKELLNPLPEKETEKADEW